MSRSDFTIAPVEPYVTNPRYLVGLTVTLVGLILLLDMYAPATLAIDVLYLLPVLTALRSPRRHYFAPAFTETKLGS